MLRLKFRIALFAAFLGGVFSPAHAREEPWNHYNNPLLMLEKEQMGIPFGKLPQSGAVTRKPFASISWSYYRGGFAWRPRTNPLKPEIKDIDYTPYTREQVKTLSPSELETLSPLEILSILECDYSYKEVYAERKKPHVEADMKAGRDTVIGNKLANRSLSHASLGHDWLWGGYCDAATGASILFPEPPKDQATKEDSLWNQGKSIYAKSKCGDGIEIKLNRETLKAFMMIAYDRANSRQDSGQLKAEVIGLQMHRDYRTGNNDRERSKGKYCESCVLGAAEDPERFLNSAPLTPSRWNLLSQALDKAKEMPTEKENARYLTHSRESDVNPGSFHMALAHSIGVKDEMIAMDRFPGDVVWNFPIVGYSSSQTGKRSVQPGAAPGTVKEVLMKTTITYSKNDDGQYPAKAELVPKTYQYYLELDKDDKIVGGSWLKNKDGSLQDHPDILWKPSTKDGNHTPEKLFTGNLEFMRKVLTPQSASPRTP